MEKKNEYTNANELFCEDTEILEEDLASGGLFGKATIEKLHDENFMQECENFYDDSFPTLADL